MEERLLQALLKPLGVVQALVEIWLLVEVEVEVVVAGVSGA